MHKKLKKIIAIICFIIVALILKIGIDKHNYYELGESDTFHLNIGKSVTVKIPQNGSTGYSNCWFNEYNCKHIRLDQRDYKSSFNESIGYIGAGGAEYLTFTGKSIGIDTIKISSIPPGDSCCCIEKPNKNRNTFYPKFYYQFIVNVKQ
jgi:predicted secreted protein